MDTSFYLGFAVAVLAILNPLGNLPVFIGHTAQDRPGVRRALAVLMALAMFALMAGFLLAGQAILSFFGISMPAFRIAGGILILLMGINMVRGGGHGSEDADDDDAPDRDDYRQAKLRLGRIMVPVAVPLFVGPGAISTVILYANQAANAEALAWLVVVLGVVMAGIALLLLAAGPIGKAVGKNGLEIATRILGLILAAIAVQFLLHGLADATVGFIDLDGILAH